jgi:predicted nucleotidyltransferase
MGIINNPNDIVERYVADYTKVYGGNLISVIMYGSAVTHEYRPRYSDINTLIVLKSFDIEEIEKGCATAAAWLKKKVAAPLFMTREYIASSLDSYPVEFVDIRSNYRVLYGEDMLAGLDIKKEHLRLQCERELKGMALHLRREFVLLHGRPKAYPALLISSIKKLLPMFKALLVLNDKPIPKLKTDIVIAIEEQYNLSVSVFSELVKPASEVRKIPAVTLFTRYAKGIDRLIASVDDFSR